MGDLLIRQKTSQVEARPLLLCSQCFKNMKKERDYKYLIHKTYTLSWTILVATAPHADFPQILSWNSYPIAIDLQIQIDHKAIYGAILNPGRNFSGDIPDWHIYQNFNKKI